MTRDEAWAALGDMHSRLEMFSPAECDRVNDLLDIIYGDGAENQSRARQRQGRQIQAGRQHARAAPGKQTPKGHSYRVGPHQKPTASEAG